MCWQITGRSDDVFCEQPAASAVLRPEVGRSAATGNANTSCIVVTSCMRMRGDRAASCSSSVTTASASRWLISIETVRRGVSCRTDGLFAARPARPYRAKSALLCLPHTHILVLIERSIDTACTRTSLLLSLSASTALCLSVGHHMHVNHDVIGITMTTICIGSHHGWNRVAAELPEITVTKETVIFLFIYLINFTIFRVLNLTSSSYSFNCISYKM